MEGAKVPWPDLGHAELCVAVRGLSLRANELQAVEMQPRYSVRGHRIICGIHDLE